MKNKKSLISELNLTYKLLSVVNSEEEYKFLQTDIKHLKSALSYFNNNSIKFISGIKLQLFGGSFGISYHVYKAFNYKKTCYETKANNNLNAYIIRRRCA